MYDFDIWEGCLSFLSLSVVWNLGCIWVKENPIKRLFDSAISKRIKDTKSYRDECGKKITELNFFLQSKGISIPQDAFLEFRKILPLYLNIYNSFENMQYYAQLISKPVCFSYVCFILGFYGLLGLLFIPLKNIEWVLNAYIAFSVFVILTLCVLVFIEIYELITKIWIKSFMDKENNSEYSSTRYLFREVYWVLFSSIVSIIVSFQPCLSFIFSNLKPYIYDTAVILPYMSFVVYFVLFALVKFILKLKIIRIDLCKKDFDNQYKKLKKKINSPNQERERLFDRAISCINKIKWCNSILKLYSKLKTMITKSSNQNINSQQDSEMNGDQQKQNVGEKQRDTKNKQKRKKKKRRAR